MGLYELRMQSIATWNIGLSLSKENMPRKAIDEMKAQHW